MNVTIENLGPCKKLVRFEIEPSAMEAARAKAALKAQSVAHLKGFRPGKAPLDVIKKLYEKDIDVEAKDKVINESFKQAMDEHKLKVVTRPEFEEISAEAGQPFQFALTVEVMPEFTVTDYKGLTVRQQHRVVTEDDMTRALDVLREQKAQYNEVQRPAAEGDIVVVTFNGSCEGKPLMEWAPDFPSLAQRTNFWVEIKDDDKFLPGFGRKLAGATAGETRQVSISAPENFAVKNLQGKSLEYEVQVIKVQVKVLPEVDDNFALSYDAVDAAQLRAGVRSDLEKELRSKISDDIRNQLMETLLQQVVFEVPEALLLEETRGVVKSIVEDNYRRGIPESVLNEQKDKISAVAQETARKRVKGELILHYIGGQEGITASNEEVRNLVASLAEQKNVRPDMLYRQLKDSDQLENLEARIIRSKVLDFLELHAKTVDAPAIPVAAEVPAA